MKMTSKKPFLTVKVSTTYDCAEGVLEALDDNEEIMNRKNIINAIASAPLNTQVKICMYFIEQYDLDSMGHLIATQLVNRKFDLKELLTKYYITDC